MELEQLKLILDTISSVSDSAGDVAIAWLVLDKVFPGIVWLITLGIIAKLIWAIVVRLSAQLPDSSIARQLRDELRVGSSGVLTHEEGVETLEKALEVVKKYNASQRKEDV